MRVCPTPNLSGVKFPETREAGPAWKNDHDSAAHRRWLDVISTPVAMSMYGVRVSMAIWFNRWRGPS